MINATLPTTDLYFLNSCRQWIDRWWRSGSVWRDGANSFHCGDHFLLIRRDQTELMEKALRWRGRLIYMIDDDIAGAASSPGLPASYRSRLTEFKSRHHDRLLERADTIVTSSDALVERFQSDSRIVADMIRLDPCWTLPFADQSHFSPSQESRLDIVHLGTASHSRALAEITPAITAALDSFPFTRFTFIGSRGAHPQLEAHPRIRRLDVMGWRRYRRWLPRQRFHLALYPLEQTLFDRARSSNKIFEHAIVGAASIYPRNWQPAKMLGGGAILAPEDPGNWTENILRAIENRLSLTKLAETAKAALMDSDIESTQRRVWASLLNLETRGRD